jgi:hypothetical protein
VSKIKSPKEKKELSLARDRRNTYGENPQASRKGIRRGKQRSHMGERRAVSQILSHLRESAGESDADEADIRAKTKLVERKHKAFKKSPDSPLGVVVKRKLARREKSSQSQTDGTARVGLKIHSEAYLKHLTSEHSTSGPLCSRIGKKVVRRAELLKGPRHGFRFQACS